MSRIATKPVTLPKGVELKIDGNNVHAKGPKGSLELNLHADVEAKLEDGEVNFSPRKPNALPVTGTMRSMVQNMVTGVSEGFERKLELVGVGYRAAMQGQDLNLSLGFSHPVVFKAPEGITLEAPSQTEIVVRGADKQRVGQAAAEIRGFRPPEPYKGKGVRYAGERIMMKEAKKA